MLKAELRKKYMQKRQALSIDEAFLLSEAVFMNFTAYFNPLPGQSVHIFIPIRKFREIDTQPFIDYCLSRGIRVFVPKVDGTRMISVEITEETVFAVNHWGISEPVSDQDAGFSHFDYIITPLLYADNKGNRVGYGKGFYDSLFSSLSGESKKIGINYFNPDELIEDVWEYDIPLDYLVTPTEVLSFLSGGE
ncbi:MULTISPECIES: 5-formyltetrahydrofolate cyclo-ligase [Chryseobacterium]|uniref:5-formyltetrahydrofolate cyclo-ligase n=1 Tax=Chryseobacterium camelliae TaxID=1265445 RepID=A0ABU0TNH5_9FLAO|nr:MULTISPECIES: 5-formyltetrahydrofolate cyclo-ligase [Chryseobacterium]MDT3407560.1 5-formyltetrahydrofolate cyclo-ligase [Pseudacidovorax intermedius]MDQ1098587.1 5-formyltetrahydrofolate cyclo-ligase [Chryseobacterium camelliae]MDQ1102511.1 5-formyltetrahydrofolate cyclo-ligase [Chryseobacterium sp. SORGH_AS_1048]MDR6085945.1 5-formyltetrahydrofolate cyclo-ligase [Chryseobacterium sp. SORGH_AS_0909]MDR6130311.1 5-formyltetrahydrofolate cyclo-ligase [Chryseobacterium sp. SORGH_AS_1175]